jgi:hypothetical protein
LAANVRTLPVPESGIGGDLNNRDGTLKREWPMVGMRTRFTAEPAPCGRTIDGEHYRDDNGEGLVIYDQYFSCGCRRTMHEYHDGSVTTSEVKHRGKVQHGHSPEHPV